MSKMSQLHAELSEQASELGFRSIEEAEANGYEVDYEKRMLVDGRELAHEDWLKEKEEILNNLIELKKYLSDCVYHCTVDDKDDYEIVEDTINFIKRGEI